jgi:hypothetical protein
MDLASIFGELVVVSDVMASLDMPVLASFLEDRGHWLRQIAVDDLLRYGATRALSDAMAATTAEVAEMGGEEMEEGLARMVVSEDMAVRSEELAEAGVEMAAEGLADLAAARAIRDAGASLAEEGILQMADGAADIGAAEALHATAEALEDAADEAADEAPE